MTAMERENQSILVKVLSYIITPDDDVDSVPDPEGRQGEGHELVQWVQDTHSNLMNGLNPFDKAFSVGVPVPVLKLLNPLRECLLSQRWGEALNLMQAVIQDHYHTANVIFKVGLELCHQLDPGRGRLLEQLLRQLESYPGLISWELYLEYIFYLLSQPGESDLVNEAQEVFKTFKKYNLHKVRATKSPLQDQLESALFDAYKGLLFYAQWVLVKYGLEESGTGMIEEVEAAYDRRMLDVYSDRALQSMKHLEELEGVWDIFITKYIQLVENRGWMEESERMLKSYADRNPTNPNAYRYLWEFYKRHDRRKEGVSTLHTLVELLPSEAVVLQLYDVHKQSGSGFSEMLPLLFNLLDHVTWQDSTQTWQLLSQLLVDILEADADEATGRSLQETWSSRLDWWPAYHFNLYSLPKVTQGVKVPEVIVYKAAVAAVFGTGCEYVDRVRELVDGDPQSVIILNRAKELAACLEVDD